MKKRCNACKAAEFDAEQNRYVCKLGHSIECTAPWYPKNLWYYKPQEECEKPRSWREMADLGFDVEVKKNPLPQLGDVLYRPCGEYAGRQNFLMPSLVRCLEYQNDECYVISYDAIGERWSDKLTDIGTTVFRSKETAKRHLHIMVDAQ